MVMMDNFAAYLCRQMAKSARKFNFGGPHGDAEFTDERSSSIRAADAVHMVVELSPGKDPTEVDRWTGPCLHLQTDGQVCSLVKYAQCILRFFFWYGHQGHFLGPCVRHRGGEVAPAPGVIPGVGPLAN